MADASDYAAALAGWDGTPAPPTPDRARQLANALATMPTVEAIKSGFTLPADVYAGRQPMGLPSQTDDLSRVADMTGLAMTGGIGGVASGAVPKEAVGIFGGKLAKTADHAALAQAEEMAAKGVSHGDIWNQTGWFQGADGKWRFEIPDNNATFKSQWLPTTQLGKELKHKDLYAAYPELRAAEVQPRNQAQMDPGLEGARGGYTGSSFFYDPLRPSSEVRSTMLHEAQHAVQAREGFARGANPIEYARGPMFDKRATALNGDLAREMMGTVSAKPDEYLPSLKYGDSARLEQIAKKHGFDSLDDAVNFLKYQNEKRTPFGQYQRTAGEVEARNVQTRRDLTPEERIARPPWETQDVPNEQQIVRFRDGPTLGSIAALPPAVQAAIALKQTPDQAQ